MALQLHRVQRPARLGRKVVADLLERRRGAHGVARNRVLALLRKPSAKGIRRPLGEAGARKRARALCHALAGKAEGATETGREGHVAQRLAEAVRQSRFLAPFLHRRLQQRLGARIEQRFPAGHGQQASGHGARAARPAAKHHGRDLQRIAQRAGKAAAEQRQPLARTIARRGENAELGIGLARDRRRVLLDGASRADRVGGIRVSFRQFRQPLVEAAARCVVAVFSGPHGRSSSRPGMASNALRAGFSSRWPVARSMASMRRSYASSMARPRASVLST